MVSPIFGGFISAILLLFAGLIWCVTIVGIPVGLQLCKLAKFTLWPFGKSVVANNVPGFKIFLNVVWAVLFGWEYALCELIIGIIYCITIIGIPFGKQYFKIAKFVFLPLCHSFE